MRLSDRAGCGAAFDRRGAARPRGIVRVILWVPSDRTGARGAMTSARTRKQRTASPRTEGNERSHRSQPGAHNADFGAYEKPAVARTIGLQNFISDSYFFN